MTRQASLRVALRYVRAQSLQDALSALAQLNALSESISDVTDTFAQHYRVAAALPTEVRSQLDALNKAAAGLKSAQAVQKSVREILASFPDDKTAQRAAKDADVMVRRFEKHIEDTRTMIRTLSKNAMPPALKAAAAVVEKGIKAKLIDPKVLRVLPWQAEDSVFGTYSEVKGQMFMVVFRIEDPFFQRGNGRVELALKESTVRTIGVFYGDWQPKPLTNPQDAVNLFLEQLEGWSGIKGMVDKTQARATLAQEIGRKLIQVGQRWSGEYDRTPKVSPGNLSVSLSVRGDRLEHLAEWEQDEISSKNTSELTQLIKKALGDLMAGVKEISVGYGEKGWYSMTVYLK